MHGLVLRGSRDKTSDWKASFDEKLEQKLSRLDHMPNLLRKGIPYGNNVVAILNHIGAGRNDRDVIEKFYGVNQLSKAGHEHMDQQLQVETAIEVNQELYYGANLVGDAGDIFYAQRGAEETVTNDFTTHELGSGIQTPTVTKADDRGELLNKIASSIKLTAATYPASNDTDTDNTGAAADVTTWLVSYTTGDFNDTDITGGIITNSGAGATEPILTRYILTTFKKTATDTLKIFVNHTANGV